MSTEKSQRETLPVTSGRKNERQVQDPHFVFITDDSAITPTFELLKLKLRKEPQSCLTLIYTLTGETSYPLFSAELETIERRFPAQLITHYVSGTEPVYPANSEKIQQILEIVINSNIRKTMQFLVLAKTELEEEVIGRLTFLGIRPNQIHSKTL